MSNNWTPTIDQLKRGIAIAEQIQRLEAEMSAIFKGQTPAHLVSRGNESSKRKKKRSLSPEGRERIAAAQRARWAKVKGKGKGKAKAKVPKSPAKPEKKKGGISPAGRARLAALMKARWAARKQGASAPTEPPAS